MMRITLMMKILTVFLSLWCFTSGSEILAFFPVPYRSHYIFAKPLLTKLAERGHKLTVYTVFPDDPAPKTYRQIDIRDCKPYFAPYSALLNELASPASAMELLHYFFDEIPTPSSVLGCPAFEELFNSTSNFDLFLTDIPHNDWYTGFAYKFKVPMINVLPNLPFPWFASSIGLGLHPGYVPVFDSRVSPKMTFADKLYNVYVYIVWMTVGRFYTTIPSEKVAKEVFGEIPPLAEIVKNTSMTFINSQPPYHVSIPVPPNVVRVAGMNIAAAKRIPEVGISKVLCGRDHKSVLRVFV